MQGNFRKALLEWSQKQLSVLRVWGGLGAPAVFLTAQGSYCSDGRRGGLGFSHPPIFNSVVCLWLPTLRPSMQALGGCCSSEFLLVLQNCSHALSPHKSLHSSVLMKTVQLLCKKSYRGKYAVLGRTIICEIPCCFSSYLATGDSSPSISFGIFLQRENLTFRVNVSSYGCSK